MYPFMLFPLGFWAALIASVTTPALSYLTAHGRMILIPSAMLSGAIIGSVFMFAYVQLMMRVDPPSYAVDGSLYVICGLSSGSIVALVAALRMAHSVNRNTSAPSNQAA